MMQANADKTLSITVEEAIKFNTVGFVLVIENGHVVAVVEEK